MIQKSNGHIKLSESLTLFPFMSFHDVSNINMGESKDLIDYKNGWKWLTFKNINIEDKYFIFMLGFNHDLLSKIEFVFNDSAFNLESNWDDWSEENEKLELIKFQNWLNTEFGSTRKFPWGEIFAEFDPKGGSSSIGISYQKQSEGKSIFRRIHSLFGRDLKSTF